MVDESDAELSLAFRRPFARLRGVQIQFKGGLTYSPQMLSDADRESALYGEVSIGDTYLPLRRLMENGRIREAEGLEDAFRPYGSYRFTNVRNSFIGASARDDHQVTGGIRYRDVRTRLCDPSQSEDSCERGYYFEARLEVANVWSTDPTRDRLMPTVRLDIVSREYMNSLRLFGRASVDANFYANAQNLAGDAREDWRLRLTGGVDLSALMMRTTGLSDITVEFAVRYQQRWSNVADQDHRRFYFVPAFRVATKF